MVLRPFALDDLEDYLELSRQFYASPAVSYSAPEENFRRTFAEALSGSPLLTALAIAEHAEAAMQGYILLSFSWSNESGGVVVWIDEIYLKDELRGQGVGTWAIREVLAKYNGHSTRFRLEASPDNDLAIKLYQHLGFESMPYLQFSHEPENF